MPLSMLALALALAALVGCGVKASPRPPASPVTQPAVTGEVRGGPTEEARPGVGETAADAASLDERRGRREADDAEDEDDEDEGAGPRPEGRWGSDEDEDDLGEFDPYSSESGLD